MRTSSAASRRGCRSEYQDLLDERDSLREEAQILRAAAEAKDVAPDVARLRAELENVERERTELRAQLDSTSQRLEESTQAMSPPTELDGEPPRRLDRPRRPAERTAKRAPEPEPAVSLADKVSDWVGSITGARDEDQGSKNGERHAATPTAVAPRTAAARPHPAADRSAPQPRVALVVTPRRRAPSAGFPAGHARPDPVEHPLKPEAQASVSASGSNATATTVLSASPLAAWRAEKPYRRENDSVAIGNGPSTSTHSAGGIASPPSDAASSTPGHERQVQGQRLPGQPQLRPPQPAPAGPRDAEQRRARRGQHRPRDRHDIRERGGRLHELPQHDTRHRAGHRRVVGQRGLRPLRDRRPPPQQPDTERDPRLREHVVGGEHDRRARSERGRRDRQRPHRRVAEHPEREHRPLAAVAEQPRAQQHRRDLRRQQQPSASASLTPPW